MFAQWNLSLADPLRGSVAQAFVALIVSIAMSAFWWMVPDAYFVAAMAGGLIAVVSAILYPFAFSIFVLPLTYFKLGDLSDSVEFLHGVTSAGLALITVAFVWRLLCVRSVEIDLRGPAAAVFVFWVFVTSSAILARDHSLSYEAWSDFSKTLLAALSFLTFISTLAQLRLLVRALLLGAALVSINTIANGWLGIGEIEGSRYAATLAGALSNPNDLALVLLLPLPFALQSAVRARCAFDHVLGFAAVALILTAIILTQSRGGLLGVLAVSGVMGSRFIKSKTALIVVGAAFGLLLYSAMGIQERESGGANDTKGESAQDRIYAWHAGINMAKAYPLSGVGVGNFVTQFPDFTPEGTQHPLTAHSIWFLALGETGAPGFIAFVLANLLIQTQLARVLGETKEEKSSAELRANAYATLAAHWGFLVSGSFLSFVYQWPLYVIVVMTAIVMREVRGEKARKLRES